jgi:hypothetical protein
LLYCYIVIFLVKILGTSAKLQYAIISFVMSVRLSDCLEKLVYHLTDSYFCTLCNAALGALHSAVYSALSHSG